MALRAGRREETRSLSQTRPGLFFPRSLPASSTHSTSDVAQDASGVHCYVFLRRVIWTDRCYFTHRLEHCHPRQRDVRGPNRQDRMHVKMFSTNKSRTFLHASVFVLARALSIGCLRLYRLASLIMLSLYLSRFINQFRGTRSTANALGRL